jgi:hypothetical protein
MKLSNNELLNEYFIETAYKYPNLTLEQIRDICYGPWKFLKQEMESGELPEIRFKYFGSFQVYRGRAELMLYNLKQRFKSNNIDHKQYFKLKEMIEKYLKRTENES